MTIDRANEIVDGIEAALASAQYVGEKFTPLSKVGASGRLEVVHALYVVTAQVFQEAFVRQATSPKSEEIFNTFARAAGSSMFGVITSFLPDSELELIASLPAPRRLPTNISDDLFDTLTKSYAEFCSESNRLTSLAMNDGLMNLETIDSFVCYLKTLKLAGRDYWPRVYERLGIDCPAEMHSTPKHLCASADKKPWWRFW
jgi:hypothetical protein